MLTIRRATERGHINHGWLDTWHSFSFGDYYDPQWMGWRSLRVINDDRVAPGHGFPMHAHRDMEIITYVLDGALEHRDSMNNGGVIKPGEIQYMSAGTGVRHSEFNPSGDAPVHLLQIWIMPRESGLTPTYAQQEFGDKRRGRLCLLASSEGRDGSIAIRQGADVYASILSSADRVEHTIAPGRGIWLQVARGEVTLDAGQPDEVTLRAGDAAVIEDKQHLTLTSPTEGELLLFDLA